MTDGIPAGGLQGGAAEGQAAARSARRPLRARLVWPRVIGLGAIHALALLAFLPALFDWRAVIVAVVGIFVFGQGINLAYHRLLTHRSFVLPRWLERAFVVLALCCMQEAPAKWVAWHRAHHAHSEAEGDPHSPHRPRRSFWWGHVGWLLVRNAAADAPGMQARWAHDILKDPFYRRLAASPALPYAIYGTHALLFFLAGLAVGWAEAGLAEGLRFGASLLVWGVFVRTVAVWHITWSVNSVSHLFGYRNHDTSDDSRNNWLVGLIAVGEGWHNNHHHDQASATTRYRWWEVDATWCVIWSLERLGLARRVIRPRAGRRGRSVAA